MEALELADIERETFRDYEESMARLSPDDAMRLQPPPKNPVLAAYDLEPEAYVLQVVEKVQSTALHDALLVLPFGKVISLMVYLDLWAKKVVPYSFILRLSIMFFSGMEYYACFADYILPPQNASSPDRG
jgi:U3 small nucleolar RNA-associated protein 12